jgi:hypothetical protein
VKRDFIFGRVKTKKFIFDSGYFYSFTYLTPVTIYCVLPDDPRMHCDLFWEKLIDRDRFLLMLEQLYSRILTLIEQFIYGTQSVELLHLLYLIDII